MRSSAIVTHIGERADADGLLALAPDVAIVAAGTRQRRHDIPGEDSAMVVEAYELLMGDAGVSFAEGDRVVVYGGGETGCEVAEFAAQRGAIVTLVSRSRQDQLARSAEMVYRSNLLARLAHHERITVLPSYHVVEIDRHSVSVAGLDGARQVLPAEYLLMAQGRDPQNELVDALLREGISTHVDRRQPPWRTDRRRGARRL